MTRVTVCRKESFEAAHFLPGYDGACARLHGHRWEVEVGISGPIDPETGMSLDLNLVKRFLKEQVVDKFDHQCLNEHHPFSHAHPTAENIAVYVRTALIGYVSKVSVGASLRWEFVRVWESPNSYVEICRGNEE